MRRKIMQLYLTVITENGRWAEGARLDGDVNIFWVSGLTPVKTLYQSLTAFKPDRIPSMSATLISTTKQHRPHCTSIAHNSNRSKIYTLIVIK